MRLILLPGFERLNETWTSNLKEGFNSDFESISVVSHITNMSKLITESNLDIEVDNLVNILNHYENCKECDYVIFAKTTGVLVVLKAISEGKIKPSKCVFLQIPIIRARINDLGIDDWLYGYDIDTLFIQRKDDLDFYFNEMSEYLKKYKLENYQLIELETLDFDIIEIQKYKNFILEYLAEIKEERVLV